MSTTKPAAAEIIAEHMEMVFQSANESDSNGEMANVVDGLFALARSVQYGLKALGNGDAMSPMGAIEAHGKCVLDGSQTLAEGMRSIADAINGLADAVREAKQ